MSYLTKQFDAELFWLITDGGIFPSTFDKHVAIPPREKAKAFYDRLKLFYEEHSDEEIAAINEQAEQDWYQEMDGTRFSKPKPPTPPEPGFVYLLQSPTGYFKIGRTRNPERRISTLDVKLPFEIEVIALIPCPDMRQLERDLHERYADKRAGGEWFALTPEDVAYIKGLEE